MWLRDWKCGVSRTPEEKYRNDATYHHMVNMLESLIRQAKFTPGEVREMAMLACINHELKNPLPTPLIHEVEDALQTLGSFRWRHS